MSGPNPDCRQLLQLVPRGYDYEVPFLAIRGRGRAPPGFKNTIEVPRCDRSVVVSPNIATSSDGIPGLHVLEGIRLLPIIHPPRSCNHAVTHDGAAQDVGSHRDHPHPVRSSRPNGERSHTHRPRRMPRPSPHRLTTTIPNRCSTSPRACSRSTPRRSGLGDHRPNLDRLHQSPYPEHRDRVVFLINPQHVSTTSC